MRKFFEGHSFTGVAIIFCVFSLGILLRFFDLGQQGPWTDELASWWFIRHLGEVWVSESHSPLYYALLRLFTGAEGDIYPLRLFTATVSALHLIEFFFLGQLVFDKKKFLVFWILICLCPADIVYARMARHYSWLLEGVLVFYLLLRLRAPTWVLTAVAAFMGFIHVFALVPISFLVLFQFWRERDKTFLFSVLSGANAVLVYYVLRISFLGPDKVAQNVAWNTADVLTFWGSVLKQFLGDAYPRNINYPVELWLSALVVGVSTLWIMLRKKESGVLFLGLFLASLLVIEALSLWLNLRSGRYLIYLVGFWIVAFVDSFDDARPGVTYGVLLLCGFYLQFMNPLLIFTSDQESIDSWKVFSEGRTAPQKLICANVYQSEYYKLGAETKCMNRVTELDLRRPLLFFDVSGMHAPASLYLTQNYDVEDYWQVAKGLMVKFVPKDQYGKSQK